MPLPILWAQAIELWLAASTTRDSVIAARPQKASESEAEAQAEKNRTDDIGSISPN
jgi:hypothetical protein